MKKFFIGMSAFALTASMMGTMSFAESLKTIKVDKIQIVGALEEQQGATIEIKEPAKGTWADKVKFELRAPSGVKWNKMTKINGKYEPQIKDDILTFDLKTNTDYEDSFYITPYFDIDRNVSKGSLSVSISSDISGDKTENIDVATISDYSVLFSSSYKKVQKNNKFDVEFTLSEAVENSILNGSVYDIVLNNATIDKDSVKIERIGGFDNLSVSNIKDDYIELKFDEKTNTKNKWKITASFTPKKDFTGEVSASFEGKGIEKVTSNVANVYDGVVTSNRAVGNIILGKSDQDLSKFYINETTGGSLSKGDYTLKVTPEYKGLSFANVKMSSETGNISVGSLAIDGNKIHFSVKDESTKPSNIAFENLKVSLDRFGFDGTYKLNLVNDKKPDDVILSMDLFNVNAPTSTTPVVENTNTSSALEVKFVIGNKNYSINKSDKMLDVAPFISKDNRTMLPLRAVAESLNMDIAWNAAEKSITLTSQDKKDVVKLVINSKVMTVNGMQVNLDSAPVIENSRTFLPVAQIANAVNVKANWDAATKTVTLTK